MLLVAHFEEVLEEGAARGQDHLVRLQPLSLAGDRDVGEVLVVAERLELGRDVRLEVVPAQAELLLVRHRRRLLR